MQKKIVQFLVCKAKTNEGEMLLGKIDEHILIENISGGMPVQNMKFQTQKRIRLLAIFLTGMFVVFMIRIGYMQFLYKHDVVTFVQMDQNLRELNAPIIAEVQKSFGIDLEGYKRVTTDEMIEGGKTDIGALSLLDIVYSSCQEDCIGKPGVFLKKKNGYILFKKKSGENGLIEIARENSRWKIVKTIKAE
jgi:hypothetical protein